ncbi:MAG: phosphoribosylformylglycinamidine synthase I [Patescibacteria group bacterium]
MAKTPLIAIVQFPGLNTEYETRRMINECGMTAEFLRWNDDPKKIAKYDGFVFPGGFSYEDRGRAGLVSALDPVMEYFKKETEKGKPLLGICNGAQMVVETGMVPGANGYPLAMALAHNKRIKNGLVLGTGYYNDWVYMKHVAPKGRTAFTSHIGEGEILYLPVAHGEGRFTTVIPDLIDQLIGNSQTVFRYCDRDGKFSHEFPVNPNGAMYNLAAVCNVNGNVMSTMPHHERSKIGPKFFESMRDYILGAERPSIKTKKLVVKEPDPMPSGEYKPASDSIQFFVELIITDNEAETIESTIAHHGFENVHLSRYTHFEISCKGKPDVKKLGKQLVQSGVLLNTNKESVAMKDG